jgi:hypothetical protein
VRLRRSGSSGLLRKPSRPAKSLDSLRARLRLFVEVTAERVCRACGIPPPKPEKEAHAASKSEGHFLTAAFAGGTELPM